MTRVEQQPLTLIARAEAADAFALAALELQWNRELGGHGEIGFLDRFADAWLGQRPSRPAWLASSPDGRPMGMIMLGVVAGLPRPGRATRPFAHISGLYVTPPARGQGIGSQLLDAAVAWCRAEGAAWVQGGVAGEDAALVRRAGFAPAEDRLLRLDLS